MKPIHFFLTLLLFSSLSLVAQTDGKVDISTITKSFPGTYSDHCFAIWVEDSNGKFVRTIKQLSLRWEQKLFKWMAASNGNTVDAVTGASPRSHGPQQAVWNCRDLNRNIVPDGKYNICIEGTQSNTQSAMHKVPFTKGITSDTQTIPDNVNIVSTKVIYTPLSSPTDLDNDGILNAVDNCPTTANPDQKDTDGDGKGDVCDNCPTKANADQVDGDGDKIGNVCDNCPTTANLDQKDTDSDGIGDVCDLDSDNDNIANDKDNCPTTANPDQADRDGDGQGDVCDQFPDLNVRFIEGSTITYFAAGKDATSYNTAKNISINKAANPPVIDGKDDEAIWKNAPLFEGQTIGKGAAEAYVSGNADAQLSWKATWDETALYVVLKIKDDIQVWNDALKGWNIDAIEFYVTKDAVVNAETGNNLARTTQAKVLWQNLYTASPAGRAIMEFRGIDNTSLSGTKTPVVGTSAARLYDEASKTTTFEIRYEWTKILTGANAFTSVAENDKIRMAFMFNDNDNAAVDARDHKVYYVEKAEPNSTLAHKDYAVVTLQKGITAVKESKSFDNLSMYPNPASGMVMFSKVIDADFYNLAGQKVLSMKNSSKADISSLSKGIYHVKTSNGLNYKLVVN